VLLPISQQSKRIAGAQQTDTVLLCSAFFALRYRYSAFPLTVCSSPRPLLQSHLPNIAASQVAFPSSNKRSDQRRAPGTISLRASALLQLCSTRLPVSGCCCPSEPTLHWSLRPGQRPDLRIYSCSSRRRCIILHCCILQPRAALVLILVLDLCRSFRRPFPVPVPVPIRCLFSTLHPPLHCPPLSPAGVLGLLGLSAQPSIRSVSVALCCARQPKSAHLPRLPGQLPLFGRRCLTCPTIADAPPACARCITLVSAVHSALRPCEPATRSHQEVHTAAPPISRLAP
jgi:hypothetical protein